MTYLVTARKWRPLVFKDVVGQAHVTTTLRNAIATNRLSHAYIFSGPRGVGKTTTARILAKAINCAHPVEFNPDNSCDLCKEMTEGRSVNIFEIDGASNRGVDEIRNLREAVRYGPAKGKYKVYIIDEVHMLTKEAFNALLKTLEEPPTYILFVFATTEIHKVPLTILSRCQRFDFRRITIGEITSSLRIIAQKENITIDDDTLFLIAKRADGSLRDAQSIFDQVVSFCGQTIDTKQMKEMLNIVDEEMFFRTTEAITKKDTKSGLSLVDEIVNRGYDIREFLNGLIEHFRNLLIVNTTGSNHLIEASDIYKKRYQETASSFLELDILRLIKIAIEAESTLRYSRQPRISLEVALLQMINIDKSIRIESLLEDLEDLKRDLTAPSKRVDVASAGIKQARTNDGVGRASMDTPFSGSAKASQPTLRPEQIVSSIVSTAEPSPMYGTFSTPSVSSVPLQSVPSRQEEQPSAELPREEVFGKWSVFVSEASRERISLGAMLSEAKIIDMKDNRLRIGCPDDFHLEGLKRNRQFLMELAEKVYGAKVKLETILTNEQSNPTQTQNITLPQQASDTRSSERAPLPKMRENDSIRNHPVVQALIREFGAKEVESK